MSNNKQRSATERLNDLEQVVSNIYQQIEYMNRDLMTAREAVILLGKKADAMSQLLNVSDESITTQMNANQLKELQARVDDLISRGILTAEDSVGGNSFVVGTELTNDDQIIAIRNQFVLASLSPEVQEKLKGAKVGDTVTVVDGQSKFKVLESYAIRQPGAPVDAAGPTEVPVEATAVPSEVASG